MSDTSSEPENRPETTLTALELGPVDFFLKPSISDAAGGNGERDLLETIKLAASA